MINATVKFMNKSLLIISAVFLGLANVAKADDTLTLDSNTGNYILTHNGAQSVWVPGTKFNPTVQSWFSAQDDGSVIYRYRLKNGKDSQQTIHGMRIMVASGAGNATAPARWQITNFPSWRGTNWAGLTWSTPIMHEDPDKVGLAPGKALEGMSFSGMFLPKVAVAEMWRITKERFVLKGTTEEESELELPDFDTPAFNQLNDLMDHDYVTRHIATPAIVISDPFDPTVVLTAIKSHIDQDLVKMNLIAPTLVASLDQALQTAINDIPAGNMNVVRRDIEKARHLIEAARPDMDKDDEADGNHDKDKSHLIDKLAARVLDFDLQYVAKRLKGR